MAEGEKKMKKYAKAVEHRLNLPADVKARVMRDFISSITARREEGMSDEEIYEELGAPQKAAAELNAQMKKFAYRKSPWRFLFAALAAYGAVELLAGLSSWILILVHCGTVGLFSKEAASIGIIGGADGPTAVFITRPGWMGYIVPIMLLVVGTWGFLRLSKCKQK